MTIAPERDLAEVYGTQLDDVLDAYQDVKATDPADEPAPRMIFPDFKDIDFDIYSNERIEQAAEAVVGTQPAIYTGLSAEGAMVPYPNPLPMGPVTYTVEGTAAPASFTHTIASSDDYVVAMVQVDGGEPVRADVGGHLTAQNIYDAVREAIEVPMRGFALFGEAWVLGDRVGPYDYVRDPDDETVSQPAAEFHATDRQAELLRWLCECTPNRGQMFGGPSSYDRVRQEEYQAQLSASYENWSRLLSEIGVPQFGEAIQGIFQQQPDREWGQGVASWTAEIGQNEPELPPVGSRARILHDVKARKAANGKRVGELVGSGFSG